MRQYDKQITYGSLLKYTWRYSLGYPGCLDIDVYCLVFVEIPMDVAVREKYQVGNMWTILLNEKSETILSC